MPRPVYTFKVLFEALCGDAEATLRASKGSLDRNHGIEVYVALGFAISSWARAQLGERETGLTVLRRVLTEYADKGNKTLLPFCHGLLAEVETTVDGAEAALARIDEALAIACETGERWTDALLHRIRGEVLLKRDPENTAKAEEAFRTAIALAKEQKARSFELRDLLAPLYGWFTEGFDTRDLKEAKALLEELAV
jgi:predicted ATPase